MPPKPPAWGRAKGAPSSPEPPKKAKQVKAAPDPVAAVTVESNGTNPPVATVTVHGTNSLGIPVFTEPTSPTAILNNLLCRTQMDPEAGPLDPLSPTVTGLQSTVRAMAMGQDIAPYKDHIQQIAANQPEKGDVVRAYVNQANHELIADLIEMRANTVRHIKRASRQNKVTVGEALVVWRMCNDQLPDLTKSLSENDRAVDTVTVVEKIDYQRQQVERSVQKKWEGTTPQGREIIRKKLWELKRQLQLEQGILPPGLEMPLEAPPEEAETPAPAT